MPDLVVRGIDTLLLERLRRLSFSRGWSHSEAVAAVIECGLFNIGDHSGSGFVGPEVDVLKEAMEALHTLPPGAGF